jgi:O-methyltransferase
MLRRALKGINNLLALGGVELKRTAPQLTTVEIGGFIYTSEHLSIQRYAPWRDDKEFSTLYESVRPHTLVDEARCYELWELIKDLDVPGDILEVGVWRGGTGVIIAEAARKWRPDSMVYLCDTFSGVVKAGALDGHYRGGEHADTSVKMVDGLLQKVGLSNYELLTGIFPDETGARVEGKIALCHVDVDVYESGRDIVKWLTPKLSPGGLIVFDDYGFSNCPGITRLVNELRRDNRWFYFYNLNGHAILRASA